jgi:outer membrane protein assembly factor BamB
VLWERDPAPGNTTLTTRSAAAVVDDLVIGSVARGRNGLFAWDRSTGAERWRLAADDSIGIHASPVASGEVVYVVNAEAMVIALDSFSGEERWRTPLIPGAGNWDYSVLSTPALAEGRLFVPTQYDALVALDATSGQELWRRHAGPGALQDAHSRTSSSSFPSSPVVTGGVLWVAGGDGLLRGLDPATGAVRWSWDLGVPASGGLTPAGDYLLVATFDGTIRAMYASACAVPLTDEGGCGCQAGGSSGAGSLLLLVAAGATLLRGRRPRASGRVRGGRVGPGAGPRCQG